MRTFQMCAYWTLLVLAACSATDKAPPSGNVTLEYAGISESLDAVTVLLANDTTQAIYFRGNPDPITGSLSMSCVTREAATGYSQGSTDPMPTVKRVTVGPTQRVRVRLWASLPPDFKNGKSSCRLKMTLEGGTVVRSREFVP